MGDDIMTASEFADAAGIEKRYVTRWARKGEVVGARLIGGGDKRGGAWIATRRAWEAAKVIERRPGRPKNDPQPTP